MNKSIKEKIMKAIAMVLLAIGVFLCVARPLAIWVITPSLSQMEVFILTWDSTLLGFILCIMGELIGKINKK